jgi:hypothetical protein
MLITIGSFSYRFDTLGTYYYWSPNASQYDGYGIRGVIEVVALEAQMLNVETVWDQFTGEHR